MEYVCDGHKYLGNTDKQPDCADGSDEKFEVCCAGDYETYNEEICSRHQCKLIDDTPCL